MAQKNFNITDFAVTRAIQELREEYDLISAQMIADYIGAEKTTVYRALRNLKRAGMVKQGRGSNRAGGFAYEYIGSR